MFGFKKKDNNFVSAADEIYNKMWCEVLDARSVIRKAAEQVIVKIGVANLYPNGAKKFHANENVEVARFQLVDACNNYEKLVQGLREWFEANKQDLNCYSHWNPDRWLSAHEYVESAYEEFFKKS